MKVVILNTADAHGGAAIASWRLLHALVGEGVDARMLVVDRTTADPLVDVAGTAEHHGTHGPLRPKRFDPPRPV